MQIPIVTTEENFFKIVLRICNPVLKLTPMQMELIGYLILISYKNRNLSKEVLESQLLSYKSRVALRHKLNISEASLNNNISNLKKKKLIITTSNGFALSHAVDFIKPNNNKLSITFNIEINEDTNRHNK